MRRLRYFDCVVVSLLDEPEEGWAEDEELGELDESLLEPAPAEPLLGVDELELDGDELDEEPPLALSFFASDEVDEDGELVVPEAELEDEPGVALGELVVPEPDIELDDEPDGDVVAPEPDGEVVEDDEVEPAGARDAPLSALLQPAIIAPPNARETARASVETFMWPPWLGYSKEAARIGPRRLRSYPAAGDSAYFVVGAVSGLVGPALSPFCWKSRCCAADLGSTWPCCGFEPSRFSAVLGAAVLAGVVEEPAAALGADDDVSVFGDTGVFVLRSQPAAKASIAAAAKASNLIGPPGKR